MEREQVVAQVRAVIARQKITPEELSGEPEKVIELCGRTYDEFCHHSYPTKEPLLASQTGGALIRHPSLVQIHGYRGVGKSNFALHMANAIAHELEFFRWTGQLLKVKRGEKRKPRVCYIEGEQPSTDIQEQCRQLDIPEKSDNLFVLTIEDQPDGRFPRIIAPDGTPLPAGLAAFEQYLVNNKIDVLFWDSFSTLTNIPTNDEAGHIAWGAWMIRLRTVLRITVVYLQHDGKSGQQRGHSKHEDFIDVSMHLTWAPGYHGEQGLRCRLHFDKARRLFNGRPMRITWAVDPDNKKKQIPVWKWTELDAAEAADEELLGEMCSLLAGDSKLSARGLFARLRLAGHKGDDKKWRPLYDQARASMEMQAARGASDDKESSEETVTPINAQPVNGKAPKY